MGASSYIQGLRFRNEENLSVYCGLDMEGQDVDRRLHRETVRLTEKEMMEEFMFLGLRMMKGVSEREFGRRFGVGIRDVYGGVLNRLEKNRLIETDGIRIRLSEFGIDISNYVLSEFLL